MQKKLYSLLEAAAVAKLVPGEILDAGSTGAIELLIGVPDEMSLRLIKEHKPEDGFGLPKSTHIPSLLALRKNHCAALKFKRATKVNNFPMGYAFSPERGFTDFYPCDCDARLPIFKTEKDSNLWREPYRQWTSWSFYDGESPVHIEINQDRVLVRNTDIDRLFGIDPGWLGNNDESFQSDKLQTMKQASRRFWGHKNIIKEDPFTHPKTKEIVDWFIEKQFSRSLAKHAATLIRPEYAAMGRPPEDLSIDERDR